MTTSAPVPDEIRQDENLGRSLTGLYAHKAPRPRALRDAFLDKRSDSLSVDRLDYASRSEMARIARDRERRREPPRDFAGWAVVDARRASRSGRRLSASPRERNPYHADIRLPDLDGRPEPAVRLLKKEHAVELAAHSRWEPAPRE